MGSYYYHTTSKTAVLAHSHYSDPSFDREAVIFGSKKDGLKWDYADRLRQWEPEKSDEAHKISVDKCGKSFTAARVERYLQEYYGNPKIEIVCIISGTQPFNGYPWHAYGYRVMGE